MAYGYALCFLDSGNSESRLQIIPSLCPPERVASARLRPTSERESQRTGTRSFSQEGYSVSC